MYYLYVTLILMLVACALWVILCFHYVLQQQRQLNAIWLRLHRLMLDHNAIVDELLHVWSSAPGIDQAMARPAELAELQQYLTQDSEADWQNVQERAALHQRIDRAAQQLVAITQQIPHVAGTPAFSGVVSKLGDSRFRLGKAVEQYNRSARIYNALLLQNPNRYVANKIGMVPVPLYAA